MTNITKLVKVLICGLAATIVLTQRLFKNEHYMCVLVEIWKTGELNLYRITEHEHENHIL